VKHWALGIALLVAAVAMAQTDDVHIVPRTLPKKADPVPHLSEAPLIKVNVNLALVPVVVTDDMGKPFPGLVKGHFQLKFDGHDEEIKHFSEDDAPVSIGLIFDRSGSMGWKIDNAKAIIKSFEKQVNPDDEIFLITFADTIDTTDFASVTDEIDSRMLFVGSKGKTSMLDAIYYGVTKMRTAKYQRKAIVIVSDGGDNHSRYTEAEVKRVVEEADVQVFSIALVNRECMVMDVPGGVHNSCSTEEKLGPYLLEELARKGGGVAYLLDNPKDIEAAVDNIGMTLRQEYILGFDPKFPKRDTRYHKLKVKLQRLPKGVPPLRVDAKNGLYATE
jgi:Ca-activated chloride channel family protein